MTNQTPEVIQAQIDALQSILDEQNKAAALPTVTGPNCYDLMGFILACDADSVKVTTAATLINAKMQDGPVIRQAYRAGLIASLEQLHNGYNLDVTRYAAEVLVLVL